MIINQHSKQVNFRTNKRNSTFDIALGLNESAERKLSSPKKSNLRRDMLSQYLTQSDMQRHLQSRKTGKKLDLT